MSVAARAERVAALPSPSVERVRLAAVALVLLSAFSASLGLAWDIRWHAVVGRDQFWSPPHVLIYGGVFLAGLTCLTIVLFETWRRRRRPAGAADDGTISFLGVFHAPLGFFVAGFGFLTLLLAAPLDDYWHQLYGIDVALWTPFHVMGMLSGVIGGLGTVYALAALAARARRRGNARVLLLGFSGTELLALYALSGLMSLLLTIAQPGSWQYPTTVLGPLEVLTYPVLLSLVLPPLFIAAVRLTNRPGAASLVALFYVLRQVVLATFVPWAIRLNVAQQGLEYRVPGQEPHFRLVEVLLPLFFLGPALVVDLLSARRGQTTAPLVGVTAALLLVAYASWAVPEAIRSAPTLGLPPEIVIPPVPASNPFLLAGPVALLAGALAGWLGGSFGALLRLNER